MVTNVHRLYVWLCDYWLCAMKSAVITTMKFAMKSAIKGKNLIDNFISTTMIDWANEDSILYSNYMSLDPINLYSVSLSSRSTSFFGFSLSLEPAFERKWEGKDGMDLIFILPKGRDPRDLTSISLFLSSKITKPDAMRCHGTRGCKRCPSTSLYELLSL